MFLTYGIFMGVMFIADAIWLSTMTPLFYRSQLKGIIDTLNIVPALLFYILYSIAVVTFVIMPAGLMGLSYLRLFMFGAFFGLVAYGTYDLTNQATISNWPVLVTLVDMAWGAFVTGTSSVLTMYIIRTFL